MARSVVLRPFIENASPCLIRRLSRVGLCTATRNGDEVSAHEPREIAQRREKDPKSLAPVDIACAPADRRKLLEKPAARKPADPRLRDAPRAPDDQGQPFERILKPQMRKELVAGEHRRQ